MKHYDLAVLGGGLAGLSLLYHLKKAGKLAGQRVLLVEPARKNSHDRSWSYWEDGAGPFDHIVHHSWPKVMLHNARTQVPCDLGTYRYKLIHSTQFYDYVQSELGDVANLERVADYARNITSTPDGVTFTIGGENYAAQLAFSSLPESLDRHTFDRPYLDQHFRGWFVNTTEPVFDPGVATLMDFRTPQCGENRFFYVLPSSPTYAMVEIAIFSNNHLTTERYDELLAEYVAAHWTTAPYEIEHTEGGNIPMTTYPFPTREGNLIYIGMRGGATRPSTGYTFYALQRQLSAIAETYPQLDTLSPWRTRDLMYDDTMLRILENGRYSASELFPRMFTKNPASRIFDFLNGESSLLQELKIMSSMPILPFGKTFLSKTVKNFV